MAEQQQPSRVERMVAVAIDKQGRPLLFLRPQKNTVEKIDSVSSPHDVTANLLAYLLDAQVIKDRRSSHLRVDEKQAAARYEPRTKV